MSWQEIQRDHPQWSLSGWRREVTHIHRHTKAEGTAPETSINPHRFSVAEQLLLSPWVISTEHSSWITVHRECVCMCERKCMYVSAKVRAHTKKNGTMTSTCSKALAASLGRLIRVIQTAFITFSTGKWEAIYFYNLAYIYGGLSLTFTSAPIIHSVMSVSAQWTQYCLIHNCLHSGVCCSQPAKSRGHSSKTTTTMHY